MRRITCALLLLAVTTASAQNRRRPEAATAEPVQPAAPAVEPLRTAGDRPIDIQHIRLDLNVDLPRRVVDAVATLNVKSLRPLPSLALDAVDFEVKGVTMTPTGKKDAVRVPFSHDGQKLTLDFDPPLTEDYAATVRIEYTVRDPKAGLHFFGPTPAEPDVPLTVWSQGESITNRYWFPCLDNPNQKQTTELIVTTAAGFEVLSNGKLLDKKTNDSGTVTFHWLQDKPHVSYLVTLVVGKFDVVREDWRGKEVSYYVPVGRRDEVARTFGRTREMLDFFSRRFGIDYPWEKYAQVVVEQFTSGGMENTSATTLTDRALHDARSLIDGDSDSLISHELGHQWWGDMVTCRDWAHLWLNEGFASFVEVVWDEHRNGTDEGLYNLWNKARAAIAGGQQRPIVDRRYPSSDSMFDSRAYPKGAWVLHMLRSQLGEEAFWKGIQTYGNEHKFKSAETADFRRTLERVTGRSLEKFFYDWTERPGNPSLDVKSEYLPDSKQVRIAVKQTQAGEPFQFPLPIQFMIDGQSQPISFAPTITEKEHVFFVNVPSRPKQVLIDPNLTVLAEIKEEKGRDLWLTQLKEAASPIARLRAADALSKSGRPGDKDALCEALAGEKFWGVQSGIATALGEVGGDKPRDALIAGLKQTNAKVRRACAEQLGKFPRDEAVAKALQGLLQAGDPSYGVEAAALSAYAKLQQPDTVSVLLPWLAKPSQNDTLARAALSGLGDSQDLSAVDTLTSWTKPGKPRFCRVSALNALATLARTGNPSEEQRKAIVKTVSACLENEGRSVRTGAVAALRELGRDAAPSLNILEAIARHDPDGRVQEQAKRTVEAIRSNAPVPVELTRLRAELDRLRKTNETLQEKLERIDKMEKK